MKGEKKMQLSTNKAKTAAVIIIALLMASLALLAMPVQPIQPVQAQTPAEISHGGTPSGVYGDPNLKDLPTGVTPAYTFATTAYMSIAPNPIGVGQPVLFNIWCSPGMDHMFYRQGYEVTIQKPDGTTEVIGPMNSYLGDDTAWFQYVPDTPGTWKAKFEAPGTYLPAGRYVDRPGVLTSANYTLWASVYYAAASTDWQEFTVQADMVASWPPAPLPTDYWTRPISIENREWWTIAGWYPWCGVYYYPNGRTLYPSNYRFTAYVQAPNTAHIVWERQGGIAGLIGGDAYQYSLSSGAGTPTIIYAGRCYQTVTKQIQTYVNGSLILWPTTVWECYDLRTGQVYWDIQGVDAPTDVLTTPPGVSTVAGAEASIGWSVSLVAITNPSGTNPGRLIMYNPYTGAASTNVTCLPVGLSAARPGIVSPGGEYGSVLFNNTYSYAIQNLGTSVPVDQRYRLIKWNVAGTSSNFTSRILSNITWPRSSLGAVDYEAGVAIVGNWASPPGPEWCIGYNIISADLNTGSVLYNIASNDTVQDSAQTLSSPVADRGKFAMAMQNLHWDCWDARTGKLLWRSELTDYPWGNWWSYSTASYDFNESKGAIIGLTYDGVYAFDWDNGHILWHFKDPAVPFEEFPYGPFQSAGVRIADGKIYAYNTEHSASQPLARGYKLYCINATTGELVWKIDSNMAPGAVADGYLTASSGYTGSMYVIGRGRSAATVTASPKTIANGAAVLIEGTVMDMSPGDQGSISNPTASLDSATKPGTVPCVSAASMETQMEYLYLQHPIDGIWHNETITGVPVILTAIGSDGSVIDIGTTTTNGYGGTFGMAWTPPKEDTYTIMASFNGDDSYGSSMATTAVTVGPAPATTPPVEIPTPVDNTMLLYGILVAVAIAIVLALIAILAIFRKH
jgi:outer membrane protein assembly factor BamB